MIQTLKKTINPINADIRCFEDLCKFFISLKKIILHVNEENLDFSVKQTIELFDSSCPYSFNLIICNFVYKVFCIKTNNTCDIYVKYLKSIQTEEEKLNKSYPKIISIFTEYITGRIFSQETDYLIEKMIEQNLINVKDVYIGSMLFAHYKTHKKNKKRKDHYDQLESTFLDNYEELSNNKWALHKQLINEGHNPNEIAKIIRNDEIEKLQEISSQTNFDFNQTIPKSLYEKCSFINQNNITLIDYAAFFSAVKCFKYLLMNDAKIDNSGKYAVAGGNEEIIHLCEQNHSSFQGSIKIAIKYHKNNIFKYIYENKLENLDDNKSKKLGEMCVSYFNYKTLLYLQKNGLDIDSKKIIVKLIKNGNIYHVRFLLKQKSN